MNHGKVYFKRAVKLHFSRKPFEHYRKRQN